jgi:hypothetical protein
MKLRAKVVVATWERLVIVHASTLAANARFGTMLFKFAMNEDHQAVRQKRKGLVGTKLGLDEDLMPTQQACKLELWPLFKEVKVAGMRTFWRAAELFINDTQICSPSSI